jgi:predicted NUDIX family NTP pyrophosphohydrolase
MHSKIVQSREKEEIADSRGFCEGITITIGGTRGKLGFKNLELGKSSISYWPLEP